MIKRIERGWAGHFCLGPQCNWHRNTLIQDDDGRGIVVTSVGALPIVKNGVRVGFEKIGANRYYETMIFVAKKEGPYIEANVTKEIFTPPDIPWCVSKEPDEGVDLIAEEIHEMNVEYVTKHFDEAYSEKG